MRKKSLKVSNVVMACLAVALILVAVVFLIIGPNPDAYFRPDPCHDARGVMVSCEG